MFEDLDAYDGPSHFFGILLKNCGLDLYDEEDLIPLTPYEESVINEGRKLMDELKAVSDAKTTKTKRERARHLLRSMLGSEFDVVDGKKIAFTDERIEKLLKMYAASNKNYGQAYLTYM